MATASRQFFSKLRWKLCLPEYLLRPSQIARRFGRKLTPRTPADVAHLPWGLDLGVASEELILNAVWFKGVYDLVLSETIWRLLDEGDACLDVGAHVGYMTSIMAARVGPTGRVDSFEPHPVLCEELRANLRRWTTSTIGKVTIHNEAVSDASGEAVLSPSSDWTTNRGTGRLAPEGDPRDGGTPGLRVVTRRLDDLFDATARVALMKLDVESHELRILNGAARLLGRRAVRDILFEDLGEHPTPAMRWLEDAGYSIFSLAKRFRGPRLCPPDRRGASPRDDPNYLATLDPGRARQRLAPPGWQVLRTRRY